MLFGHDNQMHLNAHIQYFIAKVLLISFARLPRTERIQVTCTPLRGQWHLNANIHRPTYIHKKKPKTTTNATRPPRANRACIMLPVYVMLCYVMICIRVGCFVVVARNVFSKLVCAMRPAASPVPPTVNINVRDRDRDVGCAA